jgi:DNA invertase Pin-like site-specific DNA recombinase
VLVGYMRVSSESDRQSTDLQKDALIAAGVDERNIYMDHMSGARDDRPGLAKALDYMKVGDILVVWKLDRLGRSLPHLIKIMNQLSEKKIGFRTLTEQMDTTTPHGELLFHLFGALAQYERSLARERIMAGLDAAKKRGRKGGRPKAIDNEKAEAIKNMLDSGASKASVSRTFNLPRTTLYDHLARVKGGD